MIPGKTYTPGDFLNIAWRRRWLILLPTLTVAMVAALVAAKLPSRWVSTAVISIVPQRVPESYVRSTVTIGPQDRLESIKRGILSRERLEQLIVEFDLYKNLRRSGLMDDIVNRMRDRDVKMALTKDEAFEVSFFADDPLLAQRVAQRLAALFIDENVRQRAQLAQGSSDFLKSQLAQVKAQLEATERRLEDYRRTYAGQLPDQMQGNLQGVTSTQMQLQQIRESINRDKDRRLLVEREAADIRQASADAPVIAQPRDVDAASELTLAQQLQHETSRLASLERRLTDEHPDVRRARRVVATLAEEVRLEEERAPDESAEAYPTSPAEVVRRNRLRDLSDEIAGIDLNIAGKQAEERRLQTVAAQYQSRLDAAPVREAELTALLRDYDTVSQQYKLLLANSKSAEMAEDLERRQGGEQFKLVEPARVSQRPYSPNRPMICAVGAFGALAIGLCLAGLLEFTDRTLRTKDDLISVLALPVLAVVPDMATSPQGVSVRMRLLAESAGLAVLTVATAWSMWSALSR